MNVLYSSAIKAGTEAEQQPSFSKIEPRPNPPAAIIAIDPSPKSSLYGLTPVTRMMWNDPCQVDNILFFYLFFRFQYHLF
jgi:hypothetical protein